MIRLPNTLQLERDGYASAQSNTLNLQSITDLEY